MEPDSPRPGRRARPAGHERVVALLRSSSVFGVLPTASLRELAGLVTHQQVAASTRVVVDGSEGDSIFVIQSGRFQVAVGDRVLDELAVADSFGEVAWLYHTPRTASVTALTDGEVLRLSGERLTEFLSHHPAARSSITYEASTRYTASMDDGPSDDDPQE